MPFKSLDKYCSPKCAYNYGKPLSKKSDKRIDQEAEYKELRLDYLKKHPICQAECCKKSKQIHHMNGRTGSRLIDESYFLAVCWACHKWIHLNPKEARTLGWLV